MAKRRTTDRRPATTISLSQLQSMATEQTLHRRVTPSPRENGTTVQHIELRTGASPSQASIDTDPHIHGKLAWHKALATAGAVAHTTLPAWIQTAVMVGLIFGGCCSNVRWPLTLATLDLSVPSGLCPRGHREVSLWNTLTYSTDRD